MSYYRSAPRRMLAGTRQIRMAQRPRASLGSLGDAAADQASYQAAALAELKNISAWQQRWVLDDERQRWIQIAVTAAIPLFGAGWKLLGRFLSRGD